MIPKQTVLPNNRGVASTSLPNCDQAVRRRILILGTVSAQGSLATHMVVPALPAIARDLGVANGVAEFTLTLYLVALAIGQITSGPIIDYFGRRPLLLVGGAMFASGSLICLAAPGMAWLLVGRSVQAVGAACGLVAARAVVAADQQAEGARDMALLTAIVLLSPIFAPVIGGAITVILGWHAIFSLLLAGSVIATCATAIWISGGPRRPRGSGIKVIKDWQAVIAEVDFRRNLAIAMAMSIGLYAFLASAPFFLIARFGVSEAHLGVLIGVVACGACAGALIASLLARQLTSGQLIQTGVVIALLAAVSLTATLVSGGGARAIVGTMALYAFAGGVVLPNAMMRALAPMESRVATAVSLYGALQMAGSGLATMLAGSLAGGDPMVMAAMILVAAVFASFFGLASPRKDVSYNKTAGGDA